MPAPDRQADLALLIEAARGAADIALHHWRGDPETWEKGDGQGPVSAADYAVDAYLSEHLRAARPSYGWMSEETADSLADREADTLFIVDPIDGTRAYLEGAKTWAHALAVVHRGAPIVGVVVLPARDLCYVAVEGAGATLNGEAITSVVAPPGLDAADILVTKPNLAPGLWCGAPPAPRRHFRPSLAYRMALVGQGRFDGMITLRDSWEWDVAAGALIAQEAGAQVTDRAGQPLRFNSPGRKTAGVVAAPATLHGEIAERLRPGARVD